jgi:hypothetical protein
LAGLKMLVPPAGLEPAAPGLGNLCSIHLSYGGYALSAARPALSPARVVSSLRAVFYQTEHLVSSQFVSSIQEGQIDEKRYPDDVASESAD